MSFKTILAPFLDRSTAQDAFALAAHVAARFEGRVEALHVRAHAPGPGAAYPAFPYAYAPVDIEAADAASRAAAETMRETFDALTGAASTGAAAGWREVRGLYPDAYAARARLADLTVFGRGGDAEGLLQEPVLEEVLFNSGRPVLVGAPREALFDRIAVGWNGGREAARAVSCALPLLREGGAVHVVSVGEIPDYRPGPEDACAYLAEHGVVAEPTTLSTGDSAEVPEERFLRFAAQNDVSLIVVGAYSHSRFREVLLGGFTRHLLHRSTVPVFLTH
ncbi:MAG: universal stress protein [Pseudomonadota bacterium]